MINASIRDHIFSGVGAVGYLTVDPKDYDPKSAAFVILGTGFLVRDTTIITNRHVLEGLEEAKQKDGIPESRTFVHFVYPRSTGWQQAFCRIQSAGMLGNTEFDIAFIEIKRRPEPEFGRCRPLTIVDDHSSVDVSLEVSVCGYPYGTDLLINPLLNKKDLYRFGPVLQQGYISALAPFGKSGPITEILLDVRTAGGMSGAPVFDSNDGTVIGIHYAGCEATTAFAIPLTRPQLNVWLQLHDDALNS